MRLSTRIIYPSLLLCAVGCADSRFYRVPVNTPWPDEWVAGRRNPAQEDVALATSTILWHQSLRPDTLVLDIDVILTPDPAVRHYTRVDYASAVARTRRRPQTIPIVEVKIDSALLPTTANLTPVNETWTDKPFMEAIQSLADRVGRKISVAPGTTLPDAVSGELKNADPRYALAQVLLAHDLFFTPSASAPQEIRSFEYRSRNEFLNAIRAAAKEIQGASPLDAPITVIPFVKWLQDRPEPQRFIWQINSDKEDATPTQVSLALASDPVLAKKQLTRTLSDRIK